MKTIKYISDLHLERKFNLIKFKKEQLGGTLLLAGDIGSPLQKKYWDFFDYCSFNFDNTYFIAGNHEYWNRKKISINQMNELIEEKTLNYNNVKFLNNKSVYIDNYKLIGSTLWSESNLDYSFDYKYIYLDNEKLDKQNFRKLFYKNFEYINKELEENIPTIMLTHYLPSYRFTFRNKKFNKIKSIFASNLDYLIDDPIKIWIFGHTHNQFQKKFNNVICGVNAVGYKNDINLKDINLKD